jgi:hypothetical protein
MTRFCGIVLGVLTLSAGVAQAQSAPPRILQLSFDANGDVTLMAQNVSARDILAEWARQCSCYVVNADRLTSPTLQVPVLFERKPQGVVLQALLREAAGYVLTPRREGSTGPSSYETIYVLATSVTSNTVGTYFPPTNVPYTVSTVGSPDDEIPPIRAPAPVDPTRPVNAPPTTGQPAGALPPAPPIGGVPSGSVPAVRIVPVTR